MNPDYENGLGYYPNGDLLKGEVFGPAYNWNNEAAGLVGDSGFPNNENPPEFGIFDASCPKIGACGLFYIGGYPKSGASCLSDLTDYPNNLVCNFYPKSIACCLCDTGSCPNKGTSVFLSTAD